MAAIATASFRGGNTAGLLAKVATGLFEGVSTAAKLVEGEAISRCPVDTGALVSSITSEVTCGIQNAGNGSSLARSLFSVSAIVAPHTEYAAYVEYGTGQRGASSAGAGPGPYSATWKGMAAQPYMRPALDNNRTAAEEAIKSAVRDALS